MFIGHSADVTQELTECLKSQYTLENYYRMKIACFQFVGSGLTMVSKQCPVINRCKNLVIVLTFFSLYTFTQKEEKTQ